MERRVADILNAATSRFYAQQAQSFSQTRQSAWPGWERCLPYLDELAGVAGREADGVVSDGSELCDVAPGDAGLSNVVPGDAELCDAAAEVRAAKRPLSLVDIGCGNLRFEAFLKAARPDFAVELTAVDFGSALFEQARPDIFNDAQNGELCKGEVRTDSACSDEVSGEGVLGSDECVGESCSSETYGGEMPAGKASSVGLLGVLAPGMRLASFQNLDIITQALNREPLLGVHLNEYADAVLCSGFMHHVPGCETREFVMREMLKLLRPGGVLVVSFWQFMRSPKLAKQAEQLREQALSDLKLASGDLEEGDHLLGWQKVSGVYRYCHSFSEAELDSLVETLSDLAKPVARFGADGRTGNLNAYLILRRK